MTSLLRIVFAIKDVLGVELEANLRSHDLIHFIVVVGALCNSVEMQGFFPSLATQIPRLRSAACVDQEAFILERQ